MGLSSVFIPEHNRGGVVIRMIVVTFLLRSGLGFGNSLGLVQARVSRFARVEIAGGSVHS